MALDLMADVRRLERDIAAIVTGQVGDPRRFATRDRFAAYNGTAPIEAPAAATAMRAQAVKVRRPASITTRPS